MLFPRIKGIREDNNLTQAEISAILSIKRSAYSLWELEINIIPLKYLNYFCNYFQVSMDYVLNLSSVKTYSHIQEEIDIKILATRLKQVRKKENFTQMMVAEFLNTTHSTWSAYESAKVLIPTIFIYEFAKKFHCSIDWLCGKVE